MWCGPANITVSPTCPWRWKIASAIRAVAIPVKIAIEASALASSDRTRILPGASLRDHASSLFESGFSICNSQSFGVEFSNFVPAFEIQTKARSLRNPAGIPPQCSLVLVSPAETVDEIVLSSSSLLPFDS
eukprot:2902853-Rhodomonas_salina.2